MPKWAIAAAGAALVVLLLAVTHLWTRLGDQREITRVTVEARDMRERYESIYAAVRMRDSMEKVVQTRVDELVRASDRLRGEVAQLEQRRRASQLAVHAIDDADSLQARFAVTYPELARVFRRTELRDEPTNLEIEYGMLPVWSFGAFVNYRRNAESYSEQLDSMVTLDTLRVRTLAQKDSLFALERASRLSLQQGYDTTFSRYLRLNDDYVGRLKEPRLRIAVPRWQVLLLSAAGGVALGTQFR